MDSTTFLKIDPPCPYHMPKNKVTLAAFVEFCNLKLGVSPSRVRKDIDCWLEEDHGNGDVTLFSAFEKNNLVQFFIVAKHSFILSGKTIMEEVFRVVSSNTLELFSDVHDGDFVQKGDVILAGRGSAACILLGERAALNFCSKMSGVASKTHGVLKQMQIFNNKIQLLETRKTTPGLRMYEKYSVRLGGARNHRHGLDGGAMLKENHLRSIGFLEKALTRLQNNLPILTKTEIEVTNLNELRSALACQADVVMLDNFSFADVEIAVQERNTNYPNVKLELSGNLDEKDLEKIMNSGVDYISMGALIHKSVWVDMSLQIFNVAV